MLGLVGSIPTTEENSVSKKKNIMLLSAGRRVSLARTFARVAEENGANLICADMCPESSSACQDNSVAVMLPQVNVSGYAKALENLCHEHNIGLVVPTIDLELTKLTELRDTFEAQGTIIVISAAELITVACDKRMTAAYFSEFEIRSPEIYPEYAPRYPAIAKPFDGSLSRNVHVLRNERDFSDCVRAIPNLMLAQYLDPSEYEEFTCDAYYDSEENLRCVIPRLRLEVRGGEVSKARTVRNNIVDLFESHLTHLPGARGCLTFQFFRNKATGNLYLIEVNARFGGGFPLSLAAGADYPRWLYNEYILGQHIESFSGWEDRLTMLRYDGEVFVKKDAQDG